MGKYVNRVFYFIPAFVLMVVIFAIWELGVRYMLVASSILPAPTEIPRALMDNWDVVIVHSWQTFMETVFGLLIAVVFGLVTAVFLDMSSWVRRAVYPLLVTSQTIPMIALAPLFLIWFGFGFLPKILIVILCCYFPITVATSDGFAKIDPDFTRLFKSMNTSYWQMLWKVRLPGAMPQFFSGLKIAATYSVTGALVGEYVGAYQGLGIYIQQAAHAHAIALVFAIIFVITMLTLLLVLLVILIEEIALPWYWKG